MTNSKHNRHAVSSITQTIKTIHVAVCDNCGESQHDSGISRSDLAAIVYSLGWRMDIGRTEKLLCKECYATRWDRPIDR